MPNVNELTFQISTSVQLCNIGSQHLVLAVRILADWQSTDLVPLDMLLAVAAVSMEV